MTDEELTFSGACQTASARSGARRAVGRGRRASARFAPRRRAPFAWLYLVLCAVLLSGCGEIEWFPPYQRLPTTPDLFSFPAKTGTEKLVQVTSDPVTVSGLTADSPIEITGSVGSESKYSVNGATPTDLAGTVKNGDTVTVSHTSANALGTATVSTLSIGNVSAQFVSTTRLLEAPLFTEPVRIGVVAEGDLMQASALITSIDGVAGTHVISIEDSIGSGRAVFSVSADFEPEVFSSATQTIPVLNNMRIFVRGLAPTASAPVTTTLTIDGLETVVDLSAN